MFADQAFYKNSAADGVKRLCSDYVRLIGGAVMPKGASCQIISATHAFKAGGPAVYVWLQNIEPQKAKIVVSCDTVTRLKAITKDLMRITSIQTFARLREIWLFQKPDTPRLTLDDARPYLYPDQITQTEELFNDPANANVVNKETEDIAVFAELIAAATSLEIATEEAGPLLWGQAVCDPHRVLMPLIKLAKPGIITNFIAGNPNMAI